MPIYLESSGHWSALHWGFQSLEALGVPVSKFKGFLALASSPEDAMKDLGAMFPSLCEAPVSTWISSCLICSNCR